MSNDKGGVLENNTKKCPHCGSTSTIPYKYGLILDEVHHENAKEEKYVWGGCVIHIDSSPSDYCNNCKKPFGGVMKRPKTSQSTIKEDGTKLLQRKQYEK